MRWMLLCLMMSACGDALNTPCEVAPDMAEASCDGLCPCFVYTDCVPGRECLNNQGDIVAAEVCP